MHVNNSSANLKPKYAKFSKLFILAIAALLLSSCIEAPPPEEKELDPYPKLGLNSSEASYFLNQTTFGPSTASLNSFLELDNYELWLDRQMTLPPSYQLGKVRRLTALMCYDKDQNGVLLKDTSAARYARNQIWWETVLNSDDQLRQRVAFALSQILVVSTSQGLGLEDTQYGVAGFYDVLLKHALGNYRDLLKDVTTHPAMAIFLTMIQSEKTDPSSNIHPDENYARELLQLFTLGVHELNLNGSLKLDHQGKPVPSYSQDDIEQFAKVFTGWNYANASYWKLSAHLSERTLPLVAWEGYHDISEKHLLNGVTLPAGQAAEADMDAALDNIFAHPNIAPFISHQLIQKLVKSNPSADYIERVATVFNDNGKGIKGDLAAVAKAIFLDKEAREPSNNQVSGKLKEPMIRFANLWRAFPLEGSTRNGSFWSKTSCNQPDYQYYQYSYSHLDNYVQYTGQSLNRAPSVFNFYRPNHAPQGEIRDSGYVTPEFQIMSDNNLVNSTNLLLFGIHSQVTLPPNLRTRGDKDHYAYLNISEVTRRADNVNSLLNYLDQLLLSNNMTDELRTILSTHLNSDQFTNDDAGLLEKSRDAISLIITSPDYLIQP